MRRLGPGDGTTCDVRVAGSDCTLTGRSGSTPGGVTVSHMDWEPCVYAVQLTATHVEGYSAAAIYEFVVAYDLEGGSVTGGG
jgi:hypothetical protein